MSFLTKFYKQHRVFFNLLFLIAFLYLFLFSLELMGSSLKLFGKGFVVGLVAGGALNVASAIPIIMGANIGTSVTNTLASMTQINRSSEFQRSFSAAVVHDFFNLLSVLVIFPLQYFTNFLGKAATFLGNEFQHIGGLNFLSPVKAITKPVVGAVEDLIGKNPWILLSLALFCLLFSLTRMVKSLKIIIVNKAEAWFDKYLFKTAPRALLVGLLLTLIVQSSSITTSLAVPLAGAGLLTLTQIYPYTLGANIGTTITAILAALVTGNLSAIIVAFSHLLFNISGIIIWWPLKAVPLFLANTFASFSIKNKLIPVLYILIFFFLLPVLFIFIFR
jgi:sodium-dependent phosphate cotransporter